MKLLLITFLAFCSFNSFAQIDALSLKTKTYYSENNTYSLKESNVYLKQIILYDEPEVFDEEVRYILVIAILDTTLAKQKKMFLIPADSNIIKCSFRVATNWNIFRTNIFTCFDGQVHITNWNNGLITVRENIRVHDAKNLRTFQVCGNKGV